MKFFENFVCGMEYDQVSICPALIAHFGEWFSSQSSIKFAKLVIRNERLSKLLNTRFWGFEIESWSSMSSLQTAYFAANIPVHQLPYNTVSTTAEFPILCVKSGNEFSFSFFT